MPFIVAERGGTPRRLTQHGAQGAPRNVLQAQRQSSGDENKMADGMARHVSAVAAGQRLRAARERAGYETASDFARAANVNYTSYAHHENGTRSLTRDAAVLYARMLNLPAGLLLFGDSLPEANPVPIVGIVSTSGKIEPVTHRLRHEPSTVELPDPYHLVAETVRGDEMYPAYRDGDTIFHRELSRDPDVIQSLHGLECVVERVDGSKLLRQMMLQADGRCTLHAYREPPLTDQVISAAAAVEIVQRRIPKRLTNR